MGEVMRPLQNISRKVGFTNTETNVILFIVIAFIIGLGVNFFRDSSNSNNYLEFDYSTQDSLFNAAVGDPHIQDSIIVREKKFDSKHELLDFSKADKSSGRNKKVIDSGRIININSASAIELAVLPGLGEKSIQNIIDYRNEHGSLKKTEDLLKIKGIGKKKFEKIFKLITVK
jgi:competence protein ComEA